MGLAVEKAQRGLAPRFAREPAGDLLDHDLPRIDPTADVAAQKDERNQKVNREGHRTGAVLIVNLSN